MMGARAEWARGLGRERGTRRPACLRRLGRVDAGRGAGDAGRGGRGRVQGARACARCAGACKVCMWGRAAESARGGRKRGFAAGRDWVVRAGFRGPGGNLPRLC